MENSKKYKVARTKWSKEELDILKDNYGKVSLDEMVKLLPTRNKNLIKTVACLKGFSNKNPKLGTRFTEEHKEKAIQDAIKCTASGGKWCGIALKNRTTKRTLRRWVEEAGVLEKTRVFDKWTDSELYIIKEHLCGLTYKELGDLVDRSATAVQNKVYKLGWNHNFGNLNLWSNEEIQYLKENWKEYKDSEIADYLGRSIAAVESKRRRLGLSNKRTQDV